MDEESSSNYYLHQYRFQHEILTYDVSNRTNSAVAFHHEIQVGELTATNIFFTFQLF